MSKYLFTPNPTDPATWYGCGKVSEAHARRQWDEFGFRYKGPGGRPLLDYSEKVKPSKPVEPVKPIKAVKSAPKMATPVPKSLAESAKSVVRGDREESADA